MRQGALRNVILAPLCLQNSSYLPSIVHPHGVVVDPPLKGHQLRLQPQASNVGSVLSPHTTKQTRSFGSSQKYALETGLTFGRYYAAIVVSVIFNHYK